MGSMGSMEDRIEFWRLAAAEWRESAETWDRVAESFLLTDGERTRVSVSASRCRREAAACEDLIAALSMKLESMRAGEIEAREDWPGPADWPGTGPAAPGGPARALANGAAMVACQRAGRECHALGCVACEHLPF